MGNDSREAIYHAQRNLVVFIVCAGSFLSPLTLASVNVAIPSMATALSADAVSVSLLPTVFLLSNVALMLPFAKLADNFGRKRIYLTGIAITACASLAAYFAHSIETILLLRFIQGAGSAMTFGTSLAIITSVFPASERGLPLGLNTAAIYIGLTVAPALGGAVTDIFGWRAVFLLPLPLAVTVLAIALLFLKTEWKHEQYSPFDWLGALIFACWTVALVSGLTGLPAPASLAALLLAVALGALFVWQQSRNPAPLIRVQMFRGNRLFSFSLATSSLMYAATYPMAFLLSLYLQYIKGLDALQAGQVLMVQALAMALFAPVAGRMSDSIEPRTIATCGCLLVAAGFALMTQLGMDTAGAYIVAALVLTGVGFGFFSTPNNNAVMGAVPARDIGVASASVNLARVSGNLIGISLMNLIIRQVMGEVAISPEQFDLLMRSVSLAIYLALGMVLLASVFSASRGGRLADDSP